MTDKKRGQFSSFQPLSRCTLCNPMDCSTPGFPDIINSQSLFKLMSIELVMPSNHLGLCHPLLPLPSIFPRIRVFSNELALCIRWPKYWSFRFSISPSINSRGWFPLGLAGLISLLPKGIPRVFSSITFQKYQYFDTQFSLCTYGHNFQNKCKNKGTSLVVQWMGIRLPVQGT